MRKFLMAAAVAVSAIVVAAPAAAQYYPQPGYGYAQGRNYPARIANLRQRIDRLDARDRVSENEARRLRREVRELQRLAYDWGRNGYNGWERRELDNRIYRLERLIQHERWDGRHGDRRWDDRWDDRRDGDRRDRDWRDRDRDGRWD